MTQTAPLVDEAALSAYAGPQLPGDGPLSVERLGDAGHSNLTFVVRRGSHEWILRRPPLGPLQPTAHDVIREYRVQDLLARIGGVRVPQVALACEDVDVIGAPFYLVERVPGSVVRNMLPDWLADDLDARHEVGLDMVRALVELHSAPIEPFVEARLGRPDGYLSRQLDRVGALRAATTVRELPDYEVVAGWLAAHRPESGAPTVVHGDYKLDNVVVAPGPRVVALLDWEMATVGDPLADVGYWLSFWPEAGEHDEFFENLGAVTMLPGFATRAELTAAYAAATGRDLSAIDWYVVFGIWKIAVILETSYARHLAGMSDDPFFARLEEGVPALLRRARLITGG